MSDASERGGTAQPSDDLAPPRERRPVSARLLAFASAIVAVLLVAVAFVAYRQLLYYERRAILHVPAGAELALRIDLEQVVLFEPVRRHLLPLVDRAPAGDGSPSPASSRLARLRQAGLNLGLDLREVVFAQLQAPRGWVLALGGLFGKDALLAPIEGVLREEPGVHWRVEREMIILEPSGVALGQAPDGILLIASDRALLERASPAARGYESVGLSPDGAAAFGALPSWLDGLWRTSAGASSASLLGATVRLDLGDPLRLTGEITHREAIDTAVARREMEGWLGTPAAGTSFAPQADWGGERAVAARAQLTQSSPTRVTVQSTWEQDELDRAIRSLATWLDARLARPGLPAH